MERRFAIWVLVSSASSCKQAPSTPMSLDAGGGDAVVERAPPAPVAPPTLTGAPQIDLDGLGVVAVPIGATSPRPIMIALHGGSDHPEWACDAWRGISSGHAFVVCPRGVGANDSLAWSSPADTKMRVERAIAATRTMFPAWVRPTETMVLVGFSMGATQAAGLAQAEPRRFRRVVLAESAYAPKPVMEFARPWTVGGGERAIFLCTTAGCEGTYRSAARNVAALHVPARLNIAGTTAHGMWEQVQRSMRRDWSWLIEGAEGWEDYVTPQEGEPLPGRTEEYAPAK